MSIDSNIFNCPVLTEELLREYYPISTMEELEEYIDFSEDITDVLVLASMKTNLRGEKYIEVLFVDKEYSIYRVVIQKGYVMNEKDENIFKDYLSPLMKIDFYMFAKLQNDVKKYYGDIQLRHYFRDEIAQFLMKLYYTTHRGPKEILYKANLDYIAQELDYVEDYNIVGSTPEKILGLPLNLLRIINNNGYIGGLFNPKSREKIRTLYYKYSDYFGRRYLPNTYQFLYLEELKEITGTFDKNVFRSLRRCNSDSFYECFKECYSIVRKLGKNSPYKKFLYTNDIFETRKILNSIIKFKDKFCDDELLISEISKERYIYESFGYCVIVPKTFMEIVSEAIYQKNFLYNYLYKIFALNMHILFIREKKSPYKSYITICIKNNEIILAKKENDKDISIGDMIFLTNFAHFNNIKLDDNKIDIEYEEGDIQ